MDKRGKYEQAETTAVARPDNLLDVLDILALQQQGCQLDYLRVRTFFEIAELIRHHTILPPLFAVDSEQAHALDEPKPDVLRDSREDSMHHTAIRTALRFGIEPDALREKFARQIWALIEPQRYPWNVASLAYLTNRSFDETKDIFPDCRTVYREISVFRRRLHSERYEQKKKDLIVGSSVVVGYGGQLRRGTIIGWNDNTLQVICKVADPSTKSGQRTIHVDPVGIAQVTWAPIADEQTYRTALD